MDKIAFFNEKHSQYEDQKYIGLATLCIASLCIGQRASAQFLPNSYFNVDWQMNVPLGKSFADKASGWGMNFEGGYYVSPAIALGAFISYQTNLENIPRQTLTLSNGSALTTKQKHAVFQLPFGVTGRYSWLRHSVFQPYAGLKLGAQYAELSSYYYIVKHYTDTWGILSFAGSGCKHFSAARLSARVPCGALLQLCDQQRTGVELFDRQSE